MSYIIFGLKQTRIILFEDDGVTPRYRITLQKETKEGLRLTFKFVGVERQLGSGAGWAKPLLFHGYRVALSIKWSHGMMSSAETWDGATWGTSTTVNTAQALGVIHTWASRNPCLVSPHLDLAFEFQAQPDPGKGFELGDLKGQFHTGLELDLISTVLVKGIPDWINLNDYFTDGYTDDGYGGFTP